MDSAELTEIRGLVYRGHFQKAWLKLEETTENDDKKKSITWILIWKIKILRYRSHFEDALRLIRNTIDQGFTELNPGLEFALLVEYAYLMWWKNDFRRVNDLLTRGKELLESTDDLSPLDVATFYHVTGLLEARRGNTISAVREFRLSLSIRINHPNFVDTITSWTNFAYFKMKLGDLVTALTNYELAQSKSIEIDYMQGKATSLHGIGLIKYYNGEYTKGLSTIERASLMIENIGNAIITSESYFELILISISHGLPNKVKEVNSKLTELSEDFSHELIILRKKLANAIILWHDHQMLSAVESFKITSRILDEPLIHYDHTILATKYYCLYLLDEYKLYRNDAIFDRLMKKIFQLKKVGFIQESPFFVLEIAMLEIKIKYVQGLFPDALDLIDEMVEYSQSEGIDYYIYLLGKEREYINELVNKAILSKTVSQSVYERIQSVKIEEYVYETQNLVKSFYKDTQS